MRFQSAAADVEIAYDNLLNAQIICDLPEVFQCIHREAVANGQQFQHAIAVYIPRILRVMTASHSPGFKSVTAFTVPAFLAVSLTGRYLRFRPCAEAVSGGIHIGIHIAVTADGTGMGGVALLGAGGFGDYGFIYMFMSAFPDCNILDGAVIEAVGVRAHVGEDEILAAEPLGGGLLVGGAHEVVGHGADLLAVHQQVDHVAAVLCDPVFQTVGVQRGPIDAMIRQRDAVVVAAGGGLLAHGDNAPGIALEDVAGIVVCVYLIGGKHSCAAAAGILEGTFTLPLHDPRLLVAQDHRRCNVIAGGTENTVGGGACGFGQGVLACQIGAVELPAIVLGGVDALGGDDHIAGDSSNGNLTVLRVVAVCGDILAAHGDGNGQGISGGSCQLHGEAGAVHHDLIRAVVGGDTVQRQLCGVGGHFVIRISDDGRLHSLADDIHAEAVGMQLAVTDVGGVGQCGVQVHHTHAEAVAHGLDGGIEALHQRGIRGALTNALEVVEHVHFRIGIPLGDLIQHDGGGLHGSGGGAVAVSGDEGRVVDIGIAQRILAVAEIVEAHLDADDVRLLSGIVAGVVMELHAAVHICAHSAGALQQNGAAAPSVVHQQPQVQILRHLHPPSVI